MQTRQGAIGWWVLAVAVVLGAGPHAFGQQAKEWATLEGHTAWVPSLAFSPDGRTLASASIDGTVKLWEVLTGKERATVKGHRGGAYAVAYAPEGRFLASGGVDGVVRLWDNAVRPCGSLKGLDGTVFRLSFSPNATTLAVVVIAKDSRLGHLRLWDVRAGKDRLLHGHGIDVTAVTFSADGRMLAGGDTGGVVTVWETASGKVRASLRGHRGWVWSVAFVPGSCLLASGDDATVRLWDVRTGKQRGTLKGHGGFVYHLALAGRLLASSGADRTVRLWDAVAKKQRLVLKLDEPVWCVAFSPDGKLLAAGYEDGTIRLWSVAKLLAQRGKK